MKKSNLSKIQKVKFIYNEAKTFLYDISPSDLKENGLKEYFDVKKKYKSKNDILFGLLLSLQNKQMSKNVIGLENKKKRLIFDKLLFEYNCDEILKHYTEEELLNKFIENFTINNIESPRNLWRAYTKSIISACKFVNSFDSIKDFDVFVNRFNYNEMSSAALPMLLEKEIFGLGFPLACDFLKELGYLEYPKPDVHIKDIFVAFDLCENNDYSAYKAVIEMANIVNDSAYNVDKIFWLIGSGNYYLHNITIGRNKERFIKHILCEFAK